MRDLPCFMAACVIHGAILTQSTGLRWGMEVPKAEAALPVEFVSKIPVSPLIAPVAPGNGKTEAPAAHGPGPVVPEKFKKGSPHPAKKTKPHHPKKVLTQAEREAIRRRAEARREAMERAKAERAALAEKRRQEALALAEKRRAEAQALAEKKRQEAEARRQELLERQRQEEERRREAELRHQEELARKRAILEEQRRRKAQRRAELEGQLAAMDNPDEAISQADAPSAAPVVKGKKVGGGDGGGLVASADLAESEDSVYDANGREGRDAVNAKPAGGGFGDPDGGPVGWSISGPAGSRRLLKRVVPPCPDWVTARSLDLTVQLKFRVLDEGTVKEGVLVQRTSGFPDLDKLAIDALRRWRFDSFHAPSGANTPEVWGVVKFHFVAG